MAKGRIEVVVMDQKASDLIDEIAAERDALRDKVEGLTELLEASNGREVESKLTPKIKALEEAVRENDRLKAIQPAIGSLASALALALAYAKWAAKEHQRSESLMQRAELAEEKLAEGAQDFRQMRTALIGVSACPRCDKCSGSALVALGDESRTREEEPPKGESLTEAASREVLDKHLSTLTMRVDTRRELERLMSAVNDDRLAIRPLVSQLIYVLLQDDE